MQRTLTTKLRTITTFVVLLACSPAGIPTVEAQIDVVAPKWEVRAVWLTTAGGADWPKSYNVEEQKRSLVEIFETLRLRHFNTIFFQVRPRGNTFYKSRYEPWAAELTGTLGQDPGWDPLEFAIGEAHKRGMELHAWFNVAKVYNSGQPPLSSPRHILRSHPEWAQTFEGEWWVDMGRPEVRTYTESLVMELVRLYDLDGIHLDYVRYPGEKFDDWNSFRLYSDGAERDDWRRNNITTFVREVYTQVVSEKPMMKVGSAPIGVYKPIPGAESGFSAYSLLYQDAREWLQEKIEDYVAPQIYWDFGEQQNPNDPDFRALCIDWAKNGFGRHIFAGLGVYRENIRKEIAEQVYLTRTVACQGQSFFRYENIIDLPGILLTYKYPSLIPPMPWKDSIPPLPPTEISTKRTSGTTNLIGWKEPTAATDGDGASWYVIYRSTNPDVDIDNARNILTVIPAPATTYLDEVPENNIQYYYAVTALDKGHNESVEGAEASAASRTSGTRPSHYSLGQNYPNPCTDKTYIPYELSERCPVRLTVKDSVTDKEINVVSEVQDAGSYIVAVDARLLAKGRYRYTLKAGDFTATKYLDRGE